METSAHLSTFVQRFLLPCGLLAPLIYIGADRLAGRLIPGYDFSVQSMSELIAAGSPVRTLILFLNFAPTLLLVAFGIGLWLVGTPGIIQRIIASLIISNGVFSMIAALFFPNQYGVRPVFGTPGVLLMFLSVLFFVLAMIFGAIAFHGWMRILSIAIPVSYVILASLRFITAGGSNAQPNIMIGSQERTMVYSFFLWLIALAIYLLIQTGTAEPATGTVRG